MQEEEANPRKRKPKKTVRWGDEMADSTSSSSMESSSEGKESEDRTSEEGGNENQTTGNSEISSIETEAEAEAETEKPASSQTPTLSSQETQISRRDFANVDPENEISALSRIDTQNRESESENGSPASDEIAKVETKSSSHSSSSTSSSGGGSADGKGKEDKKKKKKNKKTMSRVDDDKDNGAVGGGLWGMDLERLVVLPYF